MRNLKPKPKIMSQSNTQLSGHEVWLSDKQDVQDRTEGINVLTSRFLALRRVSKYMLRKLFFAGIYALFIGSPGDSKN